MEHAEAFIRRTLFVLFGLIFLITPLLFYPLIGEYFKFTELFEIPKMFFVYGISLSILLFWMIYCICRKKIIVGYSPVTGAFLLFLLAHILSTFFSIDLYSSIFGYPSRLHGGLLSMLCYVLLFLVYTSVFNGNDAVKHCNLLLFSALLVCVYAVVQRLGIDTTLWVQDEEIRVFSTLGQPNWLASYLLPIFFLTVYFFSNARNKLMRYGYGLLMALILLVMLLTGSRSAVLGFFAGIAILLLTFRRRLMIMMSVIAMATLLGIWQFPETFRISKQSPSFEQSISFGQNTETGRIRLAVWQGAFEIFKHYPLLGSGVETFSFSFYAHKGASLLRTTEWDFLYNKAHNEFLHILATLGLVGFLAFTYVLYTVVVASLWILKAQQQDRMFAVCILSGLTALVVSQFFGFSVVMTGLLFFLLPAFLMTLTNRSLAHYVLPLHSRIWLVAGLVGTLSVVIFGNYRLIQIVRAERLRAVAMDNASQGYIGAAYLAYSQALAATPDNPWLVNDRAYILSFVASSLYAREGYTSQVSAYLDQIERELSRSLQISRSNLLFWRKAAGAYHVLVKIDRERYKPLLLDAMRETDARVVNEIKLLEDFPRYYRDVGEDRLADEVARRLERLKDTR